MSLGVARSCGWSQGPYGDGRRRETAVSGAIQVLPGWRRPNRLMLMLIGLASALVVSFGHAQPEVQYVWIEFTSDPSGLELSVDGETIGETPVRVEVTAGRPFSYRIEGRPPDVHPFEGTVTAWSNVVHPTYMTRFTAAERAEYAASRERPATRPQSEAPAPTTRQPVYDSRTGRPAPPPGQRVTATPNYVVAFLANELELRDISCPPAPVSVITCGLSADGEAMISTLLDALFEIYLQPATREVRWYRDGPSGAYVGAFRRPEGVYVISIAGTVVSIGYAGP